METTTVAELKAIAERLAPLIATEIAAGETGVEKTPIEDVYDLGFIEVYTKLIMWSCQAISV